MMQTEAFEGCWALEPETLAPIHTGRMLGESKNWHSADCVSSKNEVDRRRILSQQHHKMPYLHKASQHVSHDKLNIMKGRAWAWFNDSSVSAIVKPMWPGTYFTYRRDSLHQPTALASRAR